VILTELQGPGFFLFFQHEEFIPEGGGWEDHFYFKQPPPFKEIEIEEKVYEVRIGEPDVEEVISKIEDKEEIIQAEMFERKVDREEAERAFRERVIVKMKKMEDLKLSLMQDEDFIILLTLI